jgi:hypothetical protein
MTYFPRSDAGREQPELEEPEAPEAPARSPFADFSDRIAAWFTGLDRGRDSRPESDYDPVEEPVAGPEPQDAAPRFPLAPFGYSRIAVDERLLEVEHELEELRARQPPPVSITEEIERLGEQTASILVVAHDKAHETTRLAREQAERCISDAAANAVSITVEAKQRLRELDTETDVVWRERERLLEDVRVVSAALASLADEASERFPAEARPSESQTTLS